MQGVAGHWVQASSNSLGHMLTSQVQAVLAHKICSPARSCTPLTQSALQRDCALEGGRHYSWTATNDSPRSALPSLLFVGKYIDCPRFIKSKLHKYYWTPARRMQSTSPTMLPSVPRSSKLSLSFRRSRQNFALVSLACYIPAFLISLRLSISTWLHDYVSRSERRTKLQYEDW